MSSQYKGSDTRCLTEAYSQVREGAWDRLKARGSQALGTLGGLGDRAVGTVRGAMAGATGNVAGVNAATQQRAVGATAGDIAKLQSYQQSVAAKVQSLKDEIDSDLQGLGITAPIDTAQITNGLDSINTGFTTAISKLAAPAPAAKPPVLPATPAATPAAAVPAAGERGNKLPINRQSAGSRPGAMTQGQPAAQGQPRNSRSRFASAAQKVPAKKAAAKTAAVKKPIGFNKSRY